MCIAGSAFVSLTSSALDVVLSSFSSPPIGDAVEHGLMHAGSSCIYALNEPSSHLRYVSPYGRGTSQPRLEAEGGVRRKLGGTVALQSLLEHQAAEAGHAR